MKRCFLFFMLSFYIFNSMAMGVYIFANLDDGQTHIINDDSYWHDDSMYEVYLDYYTANSPGTHVDLVDDGIVYRLTARNTSTIDVTGGIVSSLRADNNSAITMSSGSANYIRAWDNGVITISGGAIGSLLAGYDGTIHLVGSNFQVNGQNLSYGDKLSDFGLLTGGGSDPWYSGTVTGQLGTTKRGQTPLLSDKTA